MSVNKDMFSSIESRIDGYVDEIINMQKSLTTIKAISPEFGGQGEYKKAEYLKQKIIDLEPNKIVEIDSPDERVPEGYRKNIIALFNGKISHRTLWIVTHFDIVPPGNLEFWNSDPFKAELKNGRIYGRGVEDNHQGIISAYLALKALHDENIIPFHSVGLILVSDEETGLEEKGLKYVLEKRSDLFNIRDLYTVPDGGNSDGTMIEVAEKSLLWLKFQIIGKQGHGAHAELAINSLKATSYLMTDLNQLYEIYKCKKNSLFNFPSSTFEPTKKEPNVENINTIPGEDTFYMDCRILPEIKLDHVLHNISAIIKKIEKKFKVRINVSTVLRVDATPPTQKDAQIIKALTKAIKDVNGKSAKLMGIGGRTTATLLRKKGFQVALWSTIDETAHLPNEYCKIDNVINDAKIFSHMALQE